MATGGVIEPDNRPVKAPGVGKNSNRSDLSRQVPPLHGSKGITQGDVQALEQGQRIAPKQKQGSAAPQPSGSIQPQGSTSPVAVPDAIDFAAGRSSGPPEAPVSNPGINGSKFDSWAPILRGLVAGPGSSGQLAAAYIQQMRTVRGKSSVRPPTIIDLSAIDDGIGTMLDEGI